MQTLNKKGYCTYLFAKKINRPKNFFLIAKAIELVKSSKYDSLEYPTKHERNDDFERIPDVIYKANEINFTGKNRTGLEKITYKKTMPNDIVFYVEEIRTRKKTLTIKSMWKQKVKADNSCFFTDFDPQRIKLISSIYIILHSDTNLNPNVNNNKQTTDDIIKERLLGIIKTCKPNTLSKQDLKLLLGIVKILENNVKNGGGTLKGEVDEEGKPIVVYIPNYIPNGGAASDFHHKMANEKGAEIKYEFQQTRANISDEQKKYLKDTINKTLAIYKVEPPLKGVNVCTISQGCLGVAINSKNTRTLSPDSRCFKENGTEAFNKSVEDGWLARTDNDIITSVLTHELGQTLDILKKICHD